MVKWFVYIVLLLICAPCLLPANAKNFSEKPGSTLKRGLVARLANADTNLLKKTVKQQEPDDRKKIKEIAKAKRQSKPEKIDEAGVTPPKVKPKRQRRPAGMERPPEIPRRNGS